MSTTGNCTILDDVLSLALDSLPRVFLFRLLVLFFLFPDFLLEGGCTFLYRFPIFYYTFQCLLWFCYHVIRLSSEAAIELEMAM
jgi:hypothetical protein